MRKIAISDIHGCVRTFRYLVEEQLQLGKKDTLYLLGDYVDRGPDSKGVLDYMMQLSEAGYQLQCIKGNHEDMMVNAGRGENEGELEIWLNNGGKDTLQSFNLTDAHHLPEKYLKYIDEMPCYLEVDRYILVHAGLDFTGNGTETKDEEAFLWKLHNPLHDERAMLWIRWWYDDINWHWLRDRIVVHGHTPLQSDEITEMLDALKEDQVLDIDNGCFAKHKSGMGRLCAFDLDRRELFFQENIDMA